MRHVGIVFIHGIGAQLAGETLLDWGGAVIRVLLDARVRHGASADPVIDSQLDPGPSGSRYIELQLPAVAIDGVDVPEQHWVMTEAWWAQRVRPPAFGQMAEWLGPRGAIRRILTALLPRERGVHDPRLRPWAESYPLHRNAAGQTEEDTTPDPPGGTRQRTGTPVGRAVALVGGALYLQAVSALLLVLYGLLRTIEKILPIGPLKGGALTRPLDTFVLEWFGDVYVLLSDSAQAASVRGRLVDALEDLRAAGCEEVVVVAHSGGAIVTYMTLADPSVGGLKVDRLITLGEGLNLAWRLTAGEDGAGAEEAAVQYARLYRNMLAMHPNLHWDDFWASQDPAPVGVLEFPVPADGSDEGLLLGRVRSHATWNRLSYGEDHGGYWDNDEEFLIPVLRLLEGRAGAGALFGEAADDRDLSNRRRRRLSILSLWRQLSFVGPMAGIVIAFATGSPFLGRAADAIAGLWGAIPGSAMVTGPLVSLRGLGIETTDLGRVLAEAGVWVVAAAIAVTTAFSLIAPPERPVPWAAGRLGTWVGRGLRALPWLAGIPVVAALGYAGWRFVAGSTPAALGIGRNVAIAAIVVVVLALVVPMLVGGARRATAGWLPLVDTLLMMLAMVAVSGLVAAPVIAVLVFPDVGRTVLGSLGIVASFQALGTAGGWRWSVWDRRERAAARTGGGYRGTRRVIIQAALLFATQAALFAAVVLDSDLALVGAVGGLVGIALVGVAIDVLDASRQDRAAPADRLRAHRYHAA